MCACRCGIRVHLRDEKIRFIEGNPDHPVNGGVLCAKGSAAIMKQYSPARLTGPLRRVGPRGSGEFEAISWDEALQTAVGWLAPLRRDDPRKLAFFTGRDQSQALTGWWASQFGTPNYAAHGGFCSVNMAAAGLYTTGFSFWEFGEPDWDRTKYLVMFGVAEDHGSNPLKIGLSKLKARGAKFVSVNPVRTGYSAVADQWIGIRPGTDGLLIFSLIRELLLADKVDFEFLSRYTNSGWLVVKNPGQADDGLFARDQDGDPLVWDKKSGAPVSAMAGTGEPALIGDYVLTDGRSVTPVFQLLAKRLLDPQYAPDAVAETTGISADVIRKLAADLAHVAFEQEITVATPWTDWTGKRHESFTGRPVSFHAMRGISAHANGFHTCRALHILQLLLGSVDCPGGFRSKPPYPKPIPPPNRPTGQKGTEQPLDGSPLGFPLCPEDLLIDQDGTPERIDKAYSWEAPLAAHGAMHNVIRNAWRGDPYPIDTLFLFMANMSWNSSMATAETIAMLEDRDESTGEYKIPHIIYSDAFNSEMVPYADLILPDTTFLERYDCISLLDRPISDRNGPADAVRQPVLKPDRDVRPFQDVLLDLGARLGLPGMVTDEGEPEYPGGFPDYIVNHERQPGIGLLAGWRGESGLEHGRGAPNENQLDAYIANGCYWSSKIPDDCQFYRGVNQGYLDYAVRMGFLGSAEPIIHQIYSEPLQRFRLAAQGHGDVQPPDAMRSRVETAFDPLPFWNDSTVTAGGDLPLHAITQRPMAMYHSWDGQNAWQRQIHGDNFLYVHHETAAGYGISDGDWVKVSSGHGQITVQVRLMDGVNRATVWTWNAIGKRAGAGNLSEDAPESNSGFLLNHLIPDQRSDPESDASYSNSDPVTGQAAWYDLRVQIEKVDAPADSKTQPQFAPLPTLPGQMTRPDVLAYGAEFRKPGDA
jgi:anaerobic selenocysteine-containing dehydrogenase